MRVPVFILVFLLVLAANYGRLHTYANAGPKRQHDAFNTHRHSEKTKPLLQYKNSTVYQPDETTASSIYEAEDSPERRLIPLHRLSDPFGDAFFSRVFSMPVQQKLTGSVQLSGIFTYRYLLQKALRI